jgi:hypothetical protein
MAPLPDAGINKPLIPRDVTADQRLRRFTDVVTIVVNSLFRRGQLKRLSIDEFTIVAASPDGTAGLTGEFNAGTFGTATTPGQFLRVLETDGGLVTGGTFGPIVKADLPADLGGVDGENKSGSTMVPGQAVAVHSSGVGFVLADATDATLPAAGLVVTGAAASASVTVLTDGLLTLADWSAVTTAAAASLSAHAVYFLSTTAGKITTLAPTAGGNINHYVGRAVGPQTLDIEIGYPILL